ncbi:MAG: phosphate signaling complex protein PhoU [Planctomycetota bacterium]
MSIFFQKELEKLRKQILSLGALVEDNLAQAVRALQQRDADLAQHVEEQDAEVDHLEIETEEECLKVLALHQPVATDLRFIVSVLKMNRDLERTGDQAVNIAHKAMRLAECREWPITVDFDPMAQSARRMLRDALDSMVNVDVALARRVRAADDEVDDMKSSITERVLAAIREAPLDAEPLLAVLGAARNLERIADLATNIAADVIYMVDGDIVRHGG